VSLAWLATKLVHVRVRVALAAAGLGLSHSWWQRWKLLVAALQCQKPRDNTVLPFGSR
jgi:hypothetical protein